MIKALQVLVVLLFLHIVIKISMGKKEKKPAIELPPHEIDNDKQIIVKGLTTAEAKDSIYRFYASYNAAVTAVIVQLTTMADDLCMLRFPYDVAPDIFCYLVSHLHHAPDSNRYPQAVRGWSSFYVAETDTTEMGMFYIYAGRRNPILLISAESGNNYEPWFELEETTWVPTAQAIFVYEPPVDAAGDYVSEILV
jgi:hypothetical protein